jgi:hypothetical protein
MKAVPTPHLLKMKTNNVRSHASQQRAGKHRQTLIPMIHPLGVGFLEMQHAHADLVKNTNIATELHKMTF